MYLRISFTFFFFFSFISLFANDSTLSWIQWKKSWKKTEINTSHIYVESKRNLIKQIEVLDVRGDTERVGIYTNNFHVPYEVVFDTSLSYLLNKKISNDTTGQTILLVIRSFWINEVQYIEGKGKNSTTFTGTALPSTKLTCNVDAFIKHEGKYIPLTQVDTVLADKKEVVFSARSLCTELLSLIQNKIEDKILAENYLTKKQVDKDFIENVYDRRFKISAITDSTFSKGIYYTWQQFRNNQPVEKEFSIRSNKNQPPSLFIKDGNGNEIFTRNAFAVSDGKNIYKIQQGFVFPVCRNNHGIYWMGIENYDIKNKGLPAGFGFGGGWYVAGVEPMTTVVKIRLTPYLLNLETGKEY